MSSFINTNLASLNTQNNLTKSQNALAQSIQRLSTGLRVNSAKDDAAGLTISNRLESQIRGQTVAIRNTNDAISFSQTAEGALTQINNNLQRMRELAVQASNGTNGTSDRELLNAEFLQLQQEIGRIKNNTYFNGNNALSDKSITIQIGSDTTAYDTIKLQGINLDKVSAAVSTGLQAQTATTTAAPKATTFTQAQFDTWKSSLASANDPRASNVFFNAANGHIYEFIASGKKFDATNGSPTAVAGSTSDAISNAASQSITGIAGVADQKGYLTTITSASENAFVTDIARTKNQSVWINANDAVTEGQFAYAGAPETGKLSWTNWAGGEPNNAGNEDAVQLYTNGQWNDLPEQAVLASVVEYGGIEAPTVAANTSQAVVTIEGTATNEVNGLKQYQIKSDETFAITGSSNTKFRDENGSLITTDTNLQAGQFVYTNAADALVSADFAANGSAAKLSAVQSVSYTTAGSTESLISSNSNGVNILTQVDAQDAIKQLDEAMKQVNVAQIQQGATQNRLSAVISTLTVSNESFTNAKSHILDTDYAAETAQMARFQILQQAGMAMLAQANQLPNNVMVLLK